MPAPPLATRDRALACASISQGLVAVAFGVSPSALSSRSRCRKPVAFARQVAMYLTHTVFGVSLSRVGAAFGRDRTTASHACKVIEEARESAAIDADIGRVEKSLRALRAVRGLTLVDKQIRASRAALRCHEPLGSAPCA
jgi:hypothetical protein